MHGPQERWNKMLVPAPGNELRWQDKTVPLCELSEERAHKLPLVVSRARVAAEAAALRAKMEEAGAALWDPEVSARRNVRLVRSGHDVWGVQKCVMIFCDDFIQSVYVLPYWAEWGPLIEPIFRAIGVPTRRVVRCLLAAMPPGCNIPVHHDSGYWVTYAHRVHVPIVTDCDAGVEFRVGVNESSMAPVRFDEGDVIELNNRSKHAVHNGWNQTRVHLIFDYVDDPCPMPHRRCLVGQAEGQIETQGQTEAADTPLPFRRRVLPAGEQLVQTRRSIDLVSERGATPCPRFIIIGAMKAGTTFLYNAMCSHPLVARAKRKEPHYFDWRWRDDIDQEWAAEQAHAARDLQHGIGAGDSSSVEGSGNSGASSDSVSCPRSPPQAPQTVLDSADYMDRHRAAYMEYFPHEQLLQHPSIVSGEATPSYLFYSGRVAQRLRCVAPAGVRLIVCVREPVARAWSQYQMVADPQGTAQQLRNRGHAHLRGRTFDAIVEEEIRQLEQCGVSADGSVDLDRFQRQYLDKLPQGHGCHGFVARGLYAIQLQLWLRAGFTREQLLVLCLEELKSNPQPLLDVAFAHIGVPPQDWSSAPAPLDENAVPRNARGYAPITDDTRERLHAFYAAHNRAFFKWLGRALPWGEEGASDSGGGA